MAREVRRAVLPTRRGGPCAVAAGLGRARLQRHAMKTVSAQPALLVNGPGLSHGRAVWLMVAVTLMWSIAGVVTPHLEHARSFEVTFGRGFFPRLALVELLRPQQ